MFAFAGQLSQMFQNPFLVVLARLAALPHTVAKLSWQNWEPSAWQDLWIYRRHFTLPGERKGLRTLLRFAIETWCGRIVLSSFI